MRLVHIVIKAVLWSGFASIAQCGAALWLALRTVRWVFGKGATFHVLIDLRKYVLSFQPRHCCHDCLLRDTVLWIV